ncbi:M48 family metallopeptidase [Bacteroidales bacterium OttesenSCG-928-I21]|nr:M48 family metallopeptidase [Bacteroidales bacterium OttesenSCG-928-I21]
MKKQISVEEIGIVPLIKKKNVKRISIKLHSEKGVSVIIPINGSFAIAEKFFFKNIDWVKNKLSEQRKYTKQKKQIFFNPKTEFKSRKFRLNFIEHDKTKLIGKVENNRIDIYYNPKLVDFETAFIQKFIQKAILNALQIEGGSFLKNRIEQISKSTGINYGGLSIGNAATRWGSCKYNNDIILSCRLLLLPDELIDYIITHELCHVVHKNHGAGFHELLNKLADGKSKQLSKEIKKHSTQLKPGDFSYGYKYEHIENCKTTESKIKTPQKLKLEPKQIDTNQLKIPFDYDK